MQIIIFTILIIIFVCVGFIVKLARDFREPTNNPQHFLQNGREPSTQKVVVCVGDSHTHGFVGANYVRLLEQQFVDKEIQFVNAGINGNLAWNVLQRLDDIIACQPDMVTLLVGTNDVNATFSPEWEENYRQQQGIPETPSIGWYQENIEAIIERLQTETSAKIAILSLPMLGEDLESESNQKIIQYNALLAEIVQQKNITYLPLHQQLSKLLSPESSPPPYNGEIDLMTRAMFQHHILRKSWDDISGQNGFDVLTDHIHLNDKAAKVIANLVASLL